MKDGDSETKEMVVLGLKLLGFSAVLAAAISYIIN